MTRTSPRRLVQMMGGSLTFVQQGEFQHSECIRCMHIVHAHFVDHTAPIAVAHVDCFLRRRRLQAAVGHVAQDPWPGDPAKRGMHEWHHPLGGHRVHRRRAPVDRGRDEAGTILNCSSYNGNICERLLRVIKVRERAEKWFISGTRGRYTKM